LKSLDAVELRHPHVHDHQVGTRVLDALNDLGAGGRFQHGIAFVAEHLLQK
jgi:hypothetical protein